jgi:hypothetical protein
MQQLSAATARMARQASRWGRKQYLSTSIICAVARKGMAAAVLGMFIAVHSKYACYTEYSQLHRSYLRRRAREQLSFRNTMAQARAGQIAPDFTLTTIDGQAMTLGRGRPHLLVFLRHLG